MAAADDPSMNIFCRVGIIFKVGAIDRKRPSFWREKTTFRRAHWEKCGRGKCIVRIVTP